MNGLRGHVAFEARAPPIACFGALFGTEAQKV